MKQYTSKYLAWLLKPMKRVFETPRAFTEVTKSLPAILEPPFVLKYKSSIKPFLKGGGVYLFHMDQTLFYFVKIICKF